MLYDRFIYNTLVILPTSLVLPVKSLITRSTELVIGSDHTMYLTHLGLSVTKYIHYLTIHIFCFVSNDTHINKFCVTNKQLKYFCF